MEITSEAWECDPNSIIQYIESESDIDIAILFDDLFTHAHKGELNELSARIKARSGFRLFISD